MKKIIITGAMGAGKSTVLNTLNNKITIIPEPARAILAEQRLIHGQGLPEVDPKLFVELMLSRAIHQYNSCQSVPAIFDRGIADNIAYAELFGLNMPHVYEAARHYKYHKTVLFFSGWEDIYTTDGERKIDFSGANQFGIRLKKIYQDLGYHLVEVPQVSINERVQFIEGYL